tara:strand:- start:544 stop:1578 length:1035 start_codon:yes stop_codon:yes gene_type:complete
MMNEIINKFLKINNENKIRALPYLNNKDKWSNVFNNIEYKSIFYLESYINYQSQYYEESNFLFKNCSIIFTYDNIPISIWPICIISKKNEYKNKICSFDRNIIKPAFSKNINNKIKKNIFNTALETINTLTKDKKKFDKPVFFDNFEFKDGVSIWHQSLIKHNYKLDNFYTLYLKINDDINIIKKNFRKSYKSLLTLKDDEYNISLLNNNHKEIWNEFQILHKKVAGKITRSKKTWNIQLDNLLDNKSFFVYVSNKRNQLIGGSYFDISETECYYSTSAISKEKKYTNIGHVLQFYAIKEMIKRKIKYYRIGPMFFDELDLKNFNISKFKSGFASDIVNEYHFR